MLNDVLRQIELPEFLDRDLFGMGAHYQVHFVRGRIDLTEQSL